MTEIKKYGTTKDELNADEVLRCRQIVKTIIHFGVSERQKLKLISLLALELENNDHMRDITMTIQRCEEGVAASTLITDV